VKNSNGTGRRLIGAAFACLAISMGARVAAAPSAGASASVKALDAVLDPEMGLKEIADAIGEGKAPPANRFFLISGRIGVMIDRTPEKQGAQFEAESELVGGEWTGLEAVRSFRVYLHFKGNRFAGLVDDASSQWIEKGTLVVVIGSYAGTVKEYGTGKMVALIDVQRIISVE
jgi:hypothetical protein